MRGVAKRDCVVYVGDLPDDIRERELEDMFYKFGRIRAIDIKATGRSSPAYAFVEFDHPRDALDAVRGRDGVRFGGGRIKVEIAKGTAGPPQAPPNWRKKGTGFRIVVEGLPKHASWQDLKDMFRKVDPPVYTNVYSDTRGVFGVVEYNSHNELRNVIKDMEGVEFKNPFCEPTRVQLIDDTDGAEDDAVSRSRSPTPRRKDRSRSPVDRSPRGRSISRSRS